MKPIVFAYLAIFTVIMIGAFTLSLWGYVVLVCACFVALQVGRFIEGRRSSGQDSCDGVP